MSTSASCVLSPRARSRWGEIVARSRVASEKVSRYLLDARGALASWSRGSRSPMSDRTSRASHYALSDGFLRFWFRFVFPFQADLEAGLDRRRLFDAEVAPNLASHLAPAVEDVARDWVRRNGLADVSRVGGWWPSAPPLRRSGERTTEEIDIVGTASGRVVLVGEVRGGRPRWMSASWVTRSLQAAGARQAARVVDEPVIVLVSRAGFTPTP